MRVEPDAVAVGDSVARVVLQQRAKLMHSARVEPLELGEQRNLRLERVQCAALVFARMDQHRHRAAERDIAETLRRRLSKNGSAGERQRAHQPVAERIMEHGRASPRGVKADLLLRFEHGHLGLLRQARPPPTVRRSRRQ